MEQEKEENKNDDDGENKINENRASTDEQANSCRTC